MSSAAAPTKICVVGAGRLGQLVIERCADIAELQLHAVLVRQSKPSLHNIPDSAHILVSDDPQAAIDLADVVIDFSAPAACALLLDHARRSKTAYLVASTGLSAADHAAIDKASEAIPVLQAANTSVGVNVLLELAALASRRLGGDFDIEIQEIHHRHKRDAPSGTALALGAAVKHERQDLDEHYGRAGHSQARRANELGYASLRGGEVAGEHTLFFFGDGERIELTHRASSPAIFADGALRAARWLHGRTAGRYTMADLLRG